MTDLFDFGQRQGEKLRDAGLAQTAAHNPGWMARALEIVRDALQPGAEVMGEDLRALPGIGEPDHPNAWGALVRTALGRGLLEETGRFEKAKRKSIHAHRLMVYRRTTLS